METCSTYTLYKYAMHEVNIRQTMQVQTMWIDRLLLHKSQTKTEQEQALVHVRQLELACNIAKPFVVSINDHTVMSVS